ncbi:hypothetical protein OG271_10675 [Micromonospora rifamycinica]|uniref:hypothetical protein n=1 Tax=Micromonospora rifamycinica TaxID=291594 RepID=UPI002E2A30B4|nr:hypothetical protein [Micromonospora rifamycinica]
MDEQSRPTNPAATGPGVIHGDLGPIAGRPRWVLPVTLLVLGAAAAVDLVTFHQVLLLALDETEEMIWAAVVGFVVVAIALSHHTGLQARQATNARNVPGARLTAWLCLLVWAGLGLMAFLFRLVVAEPSAAGASFDVDVEALTETPEDHSQTLSALLFLALYLGTGVISGLAGFLRFEPAAKQYGRARARLTTLARRRAESGWLLTGAREIQGAIDRERERQEEERIRTEGEYQALAQRLKREARTLLHTIRGRQRAAAGPAHPAGPDPIPEGDTA